MEYVDVKFLNQISPFEWFVDENGNAAVKINVKSHLIEVFKKHKNDGFECCGYDWCTIIMLYINEKMKKDLLSFDYDPDNENVIIISKNQVALKEFSLNFRKDYDNTHLIESLMSQVDYRL
ncbi:MAG: Imm51 family immunity protein [Bacilli bacterium]